MKYKLELENIKCHGCANNIQSSLMKINGIQKVNVDIENEVVEIEADDTTIKDQFINKLAEMGYPEKGNNNLISKAKSYVSCMVGRMQ